MNAIRTVSRRRFMRIMAASAGAAATIGPAGADGLSQGATPAPVTWRGLAMDNLASIEIRHTDPRKAQRLIEIATTEVRRYESIFSLYRPDSAISTLNRERVLKDPPLDLIRILADAARFGAATDGRFDVTVQPLWKIYADYFSAPQHDPAGPAIDQIHNAARKVDYRRLEIEPTAVGFGSEGMQLTLNGIAQGYITDRVVEILRNEGLEHALVDLGEIRTIGCKESGTSWEAGVENPLERTSTLTEVPLDGKALATSGGYGFQFDDKGRFHHIFDPATGACPHRYASVSVIAGDATTADALATAGNLMDPAAFKLALQTSGAERALLVIPDGTNQWIVASN